MRKIVSSLMVIALCICVFNSCAAFGKTITDPERFSEIYSDLYKLGDSSHSYYSYLLLFSGEKPEGIGEFYYDYSPGKDVTDAYVIYFTYTLSEDKFESTAEKMKNFSVTYKGRTNTVIYDDEHFAYPAVVLSWATENSEHAPSEYVMLDYDNCRFICVYKMLTKYSEFEDSIDVNVKPSSFTDIIPDGVSNYYTDDYSIYCFPGYEGDYSFPDPNDLEYDSPFAE